MFFKIEFGAALIAFEVVPSDADIVLFDEIYDS